MGVVYSMSLFYKNVLMQHQLSLRYTLMLYNIVLKHKKQDIQAWKWKNSNHCSLLSIVNHIPWALKCFGIFLCKKENRMSKRWQQKKNPNALICWVERFQVLLESVISVSFNDNHLNGANIITESLELKWSN